MARNVATISIDKFNKGVNKLLEEARIGTDEAKEALNLLQVQDGLWKPRWGTAYYGADLGANPDGAAEFMKTDGSTELVAIAGGKAYKSTDGGSWTEITGATFTSGNQCFFLQIQGFLYIANGVNTLTRYNGSTLSTYTEIDAPANLAGVATAINGTGYTYYAEVTALNDVGETVGSTQASCTCTKRRDMWKTDGTEYITWTWDTVSGATKYQLYIGVESGKTELLTSTTALTFKDDGTLQTNPYVVPPIINSTGAPKFKSMTLSGGRIWATNDPDNMYAVYWSGTDANLGNFTDAYGGGILLLDQGGKELPKAVIHYQSGQGDGRATALCSTPEGKGAVWQFTISQATVGDTSFSIPSGVKVVGSSGTDAQLSVCADNNNIWFFNRRGIFTLGPEKNYYGILRTNEISSRIRPYIRGLIGSQLSKVCSYFYDAKVFFSVPTASTGNNRIIYYDTERMNWVVDWSIGAKQFFEYTDTSGNTHFLYVPVTGNQIIELSANIQGDLGVAFSTSYVSGRYPLQKLWKDFMKVKRVFIKVGNPRGSINFEVMGAQRGKPFSSVGTATISSLISMTGMGFDLIGSVKMGDTAGTPTSFSDSADPHFVKINKKLRDIQFRITTESIDADYVLQSLIIEGKPLRINPPSSWKLTN